MRFFCTITLLIWTIFLWAQPKDFPPPLDENLGGTNYKHAAVKQYDFSKSPKGYWLYEPAEPKPDSANVIVFNHGYGAYNPMIYGGWIKHLVRKGNIVIYPRYQRNLVFPRPKKFGRNSSKGIRDALEELQNGEYPKPLFEAFAFVGHSYGGVISADLAANYEEYEIPKPKILMMCSPGTGPMKGGRLDSYEGLDEDLKLIIMTTSNDEVVGDEFAWLVFNTALDTPQRNLIQQFPDSRGAHQINAGHNECYSLDLEFDSGLRNFTAKRALRISQLNPLDYNGYWKIMDAALECVLQNQFCEVALGNTPNQRRLGEWSDGTPILPLNVILPTREVKE